MTAFVKKVCPSCEAWVIPGELDPDADVGCECSKGDAVAPPPADVAFVMARFPTAAEAAEMRRAFQRTHVVGQVGEALLIRPRGVDP